MNKMRVFAHSCNAVLMTAFLCLVSTSAVQAANWSASTTGTSTSVPVNYSQYGKVYQVSGTYTPSVSANAVSVSSTVSTAAEVGVIATDNATRTIQETLTGRAWATWSWTGVPGQSPSVQAQLTVDVEDSLIYAYSLSMATAGELAVSRAWSAIQGYADVNSGAATRRGVITATARTDMEDAFIWEAYGDVDDDFGNATLSNLTEVENETATYAQVYANADYDLQLSQTYWTAAGASSVSAQARFDIVLDLWVTANSGGIASANGQASILGNTSVVFSF